MASHKVTGVQALQFGETQTWSPALHSPPRTMWEWSSSPWALTSEFFQPQVNNNNMAVVDFQRHYFSHKSAKGLRKPPCGPFGSFVYLELAEREVCQQLVQVLLQISWKVSRSKALIPFLFLSLLRIIRFRDTVISKQELDDIHLVSSLDLGREDKAQTIHFWLQQEGDV